VTSVVDESKAAAPQLQSALGPQALERLGAGPLADVLASVDQAIVLVDGDGRGWPVNAAASALIGDPQGDDAGHGPLDWVDPEDRRQLIGLLANIDDQIEQSWFDFSCRLTQTGTEIAARGRRVELDGRAWMVLLIAETAESKRRSRETAAIAEIAASLTFDQAMETTLNALAASVVRVTDAVACAVTRIDEKAQEFRLIGTCGHPDGYVEAVEASYRAGANLASLEAFRTRSPVLRSRSTYVLKDANQAAVHQLIRDANWDVIVSVPLIYRDRAVGALSCSYPIGMQPDRSEIEFLEIIADQAAVAMETARLFDEVQGKAALVERQKLARELHDSVSQALYGIALGARTARALLDRDPSRVAEPLDYVLQLAEAGLAEMRALIFELRPESLEREGLIAALEKQVMNLRARHGLDVVATWSDEPTLSVPVKEALYRIAQEALNNVIKHAQATRIEVTLTSSRPGQTVLEIVDNGRGFDPDGSFPGHLGLQSMRERIERLGGSILIESAPNHRTKVRVELAS
jgi:signal transduction histidine kinase